MGEEAKDPHTQSGHRLLTKFAVRPGRAEALRVTSVSLCTPGWEPATPQSSMPDTSQPRGDPHVSAEQKEVALLLDGWPTGVTQGQRDREGRLWSWWRERQEEGGEVLCRRSQSVRGL